MVKSTLDDRIVRNTVVASSTGHTYTTDNTNSDKNAFTVRVICLFLRNRVSGSPIPIGYSSTALTAANSNCTTKMPSHCVDCTAFTSIPRKSKIYHQDGSKLIELGAKPQSQYRDTRTLASKSLSIWSQSCFLVRHQAPSRRWAFTLTYQSERQSSTWRRSSYIRNRGKAQFSRHITSALQKLTKTASYHWMVIFSKFR